MSDLLAMLRRVFIEKRNATVIYMCDEMTMRNSHNFIYSPQHVQQQLTVLSNAF